MRKYISLIALLLCVQILFAVDPSVTLTTYYAGIDGKATDSNDALRVQLCTIISTGYVSTSYSNLKDQMYAASSNPTDFVNGSTKTMEDIYSSYPYTASQNGSSANNCGQGWNKEHTVPQSYFSEASPMVSDAHHVFPTDIRMNSCRSNYPYGENNAAKYCGSYGYGHLGTSTFSGYTGTVFDPGTKEECGGESYRGDLARVYFYMVTRYRTTNFTQDNQHNGAISFTYSNGVADLTDYMKNLMLKWHREDPVSEKELKRNNAIYAHQHNRNPFVDYPCLVEYIWGEHKGEAVNLSELISGYSGEGTDCCSSTPTPSYSVSWMANGSSFATSTTRPDDPDDCSSTRVFRGWTGIADYSGNTAPSDLFTTGNPTITKDTTFYAVYANKITSGSGESNTENFVFANNGYTNQQVVENATEGDVNITFDKGTNSNKPKYYDTGTAIRCYGGNTISVTATGISQIVFTFASGEDSNTIDAVPGTYDANTKTWTGSANEVVFTIDGTTGHRRVKTITVTAGGSTTTYSNFSLTCETGSTIYGVDPSYYESLEGKSDSQLRSALTVFLYNHHTLFDKYGGTGTQNWDFPFDYDANGEVWDIYTQNCHMTNTQGSSGSCCCTGLNREHLVCQSTFGGSDNTDKIPQYCDRHHLFLTDARTNQIRSDQAFGECDPNATTTTIGNGTSCTNCTDHALGRKGKVTTFAELYDSDEDIYEPGDEYKGDIARAVLYMVVRYAEQQYCRLPDGAQYCEASGGGTIASNHSLKQANEHYTTTWKNKGAKTASTIGQMFSTSLDVNYGLSAYGDSLLLKWHRQDPVSKKEIDRNAGVEAVQGNRNPFVDCPDLVEYLWGTKQGESFSVGGSGEIPTPTPVETKYTITWNVKGETTSDQVTENTQPTAPSVSDCSESRVFKGWTTTSTVSGEAPTPLYAADDIPNATSAVTYYAVFADKETSSGQITVTDSLSRAFTGVTGTGYVEWTDKEATSGAVYAGNSAGGNSAIQMRSDQSTAGIITTTSPGSVENVTLVWNSNTNTSRVVNVYGKNTPYTSAADLYSTETQGTLLGTMKMDTRTSLDINGTYAYVGIRSNSGALYLDSVLFAWSTTGSTTTTYSNYGLACSSQVPEYTVILNDNGSEISTTGPVGTPIAADDPEPCKEAYSFVGWSTTQYTTPTTTAPLVYASNAIPAISADATYYAVYSQTEEGDLVPTNNYSKIMTTSELTDANYLIVADTTESGDLVALTTTWKDTYYLAPSVKLTSVNDIITTDGDTIIWQITKDAENSQITIHNADSGYFYIEKSTSGTKTYYNIKLGNNTTDNKFTYSVSNGAWILTSVTYSNRQLEYYKSSQRWAIYTSQDAPIYLYKQLWTPDTVTTYTTAPDCSDPGTTTDLEETQLSPHAQKLLINGQLFILRGNTLYDITGQRVR